LSALLKQIYHPPVAMVFCGVQKRIVAQRIWTVSVFSCRAASDDKFGNDLEFRRF
jgi:hypothetical protein